MKKEERRLFCLLKRYAFKRGDFTLSSGKKSLYYIDARVVTLSPEGVYLCAKIIFEKILDEKISALGGPCIGADPILGAIAIYSFIKKTPIKTFIIRKEPKAHGRKRLIEGQDLKKGDSVILIDDVVTTGSSLLKSKEILAEIGVKVKKVICLVDRGEGARENLKKEEIELVSIFKIEDFLKNV